MKRNPTVNFIEAATAYVQGRLDAWVAGLRGSLLEPAALAHAREASWILPNEGLEHIRLGSMFPGMEIFIINQATAVFRRNALPLAQAKRDIANRALKDLTDADAAIKAHSNAPAPIPAALTPNTLQDNPEPPKAAPEPSSDDSRAMAQACSMAEALVYRKLRGLPPSFFHPWPRGKPA